MNNIYLKRAHRAAISIPSATRVLGYSAGRVLLNLLSHGVNGCVEGDFVVVISKAIACR